MLLRHMTPEPAPQVTVFRTSTFAQNYRNFCVIVTCHVVKNRGVDYGYRLAPAHCPCSQPSCFHRCFSEEDVWNGSTRWRFRIPAGVSVLWTHHAALRNMLPGVWQSIQTSLKWHTPYADASSAH